MTRDRSRSALLRAAAFVPALVMLLASCGDDNPAAPGCGDGAPPT